MKPLTWNRAKPVLPLMNRPSILHLLEHLARCEVSEVGINLHYRPETIRHLTPDIQALGLRVSFLEEREILGTGGGLKNFEPILRNGTLVMVNSDFVTDCPIPLALDHHRRCGAMATLVLAPYREGTEYGAVEMDPSGRIVRIAGRPGPESGNRRFHFTGIHLIEPAVFDEIPPRVKSEINREIYPKLIERGELISGFLHEGFWRELGTPQRYLDGSLDLLERGDLPGLQKIRYREGVYSATPCETLLGKIEPGLLAGEQVIMEAGSSAAQCILGNRVRLRSGSQLRKVVVWDDGEIGADAVLDECIVAEKARVPKGARLFRKILMDRSGYEGETKGLETLDGLLVASF
jgi:NDP-sugar pyrophosphorylase family protein